MIGAVRMVLISFGHKQMLKNTFMFEDSSL